MKRQLRSLIFFLFCSASRNIISLKTPEQELWSMIEKVGKLSKEIEESVTCIEQLPNVQ